MIKYQFHFFNDMKKNCYGYPKIRNQICWAENLANNADKPCSMFNLRVALNPFLHVTALPKNRNPGFEYPIHHYLVTVYHQRIVLLCCLK